MVNEEITKKILKEELSFYHDFWKHYIELEKLFLETEKYVAISDNNKNAYSIQYDILLQAICAEVDIVIKRLCYEYNSASNPQNMYEYIQNILKYDPDLIDIQASLELYNMVISPWKNIGFRMVNNKEKLIEPYWWTNYTALKHRRLTFSKSNNEFHIHERNIKNANQKNVLGALAGLFTLEIRWLHKMRERFSKLLKNGNYPVDTIEISNMFNDSIFQKGIEIIEAL